MTNSLLENTLARSGDLMASFTRPPPMFTRQCERASGILHPCDIMMAELHVCQYVEQFVDSRHYDGTPISIFTTVCRQLTL